MNFNQIKIIFTLLVVSISSTELKQFRAPAGGINGGGGGDTVVFQTGESHFADTYAQIDKYHDNEITFSKALKEKIDTLNILKRFYLVKPKDDSYDIIDSHTAFYAVDQLPSNPICDKRLKYNDVPNEAHVEQVACTIGTETWIRTSIFERMSLEDQSLLIFHEALRRNSDLDDVTIATITNGMIVAVRNLELQSNPGQIVPLTAEEKLMVRRMFRSLQIAYGATPEQARTILKDHIITAHGGIFNGTPTQFENLSAGVIIGIGSYVVSDSIIGEKSILINTNICRNSCTIGVNTFIKDFYFLDWVSTNGNSRLGTYWELSNKGSNENRIQIGSDVFVNEAKIIFNEMHFTNFGTFRFSGKSLRINDRAHLTGWSSFYLSNLQAEIGTDAKLDHFRIQKSMSNIRIEPSTTIENLEILEIATEYPVSFSGTIQGNDKTKCASLNRDGNGTTPRGLGKMFSSSNTYIKMKSLDEVIRNCSEK